MVLKSRSGSHRVASGCSLRAAELAPETKRTTGAQGARPVSGLSTIQKEIDDIT